MSIGSISWSLGGRNQGLYVRENQSGNWHKHLIGDIIEDCESASFWQEISTNLFKARTWDHFLWWTSVEGEIWNCLPKDDTPTCCSLQLQKSPLCVFCKCSHACYLFCTAGYHKSTCFSCNKRLFLPAASAAKPPFFSILKSDKGNWRTDKKWLNKHKHCSIQGLHLWLLAVSPPAWAFPQTYQDRRS